MKKPSRTVPRRRQSVSPTPRHLPLVDILIDTQAELQELVVASGLKVLEAMLEEDRAAVCGPRYAHQPARQAYRTGHTPSQVVLGGRKVAIRRPRARRAGEEVPLPTARAFANADPLNRRVVDQMLIGVAGGDRLGATSSRRPPAGQREAGLQLVQLRIQQLVLHQQFADFGPQPAAVVVHGLGHSALQAGLARRQKLVAPLRGPRRRDAQLPRHRLEILTP